ncbi:MAG: NAD-dependent epimerase/dehydratase family protein, partial [Synechococcaceae cyanobacterium]|nr:NAD-dependent epimerase/dehydratase family protein [Synechococcaceae cyanobacterium]
LTGASGWFGRTALWEFEQLFGAEALRAQVVPLASEAKLIHFGSSHGPVRALPLAQLSQVENPGGLLHLAFLTRERVASEGLESYIHKNRAITSAVAAFLQQHPTIPIITTSSGAAAALDVCPPDLARDPYATLKQEEERLWLHNAAHRMAVVFRVYAASGRFLKDPAIFALGDFIRQAQAGQPVLIRSTRPVIRSYVPVGTLMRLAWLMLRNPLPIGYRQVDAVTHTLSLLELATLISQHWGLPAPQSSIDPSLAADSYAADPTAFAALLAQYNIAVPTMLEQILDTAAV